MVRGRPAVTFAVQLSQTPRSAITRVDHGFFAFSNGCSIEGMKTIQRNIYFPRTSNFGAKWLASPDSVKGIEPIVRNIGRNILTSLPSPRVAARVSSPLQPARRQHRRF